MRPNKTAKRIRTRNEALDAEAITALLQSAESDRDHALIRLGVSVGLRVSEVANIRPSDIDLDRGAVKIWDEKKDVWRDVVPDNATLATIRRYLHGLGSSEWLFPGDRGGPLSHKTIERIIQRTTRAAIGRPLSWHSLRHTYLTRCQELGIPMSIAMGNTGNSPETILRYYSRLPQSTVKRIINSSPVIPERA